MLFLVKRRVVLLQTTACFFSAVCGLVFLEVLVSLEVLVFLVSLEHLELLELLAQPRSPLTSNL